MSSWRVSSFYGFIAVVILVPFVQQNLGGSGFSVLTVSIILGIMMMLTILSIANDSLLALLPSYREGSIALGAT